MFLIHLPSCFPPPPPPPPLRFSLGLIVKTCSPILESSILRPLGLTLTFTYVTIVNALLGRYPLCRRPSMPLFCFIPVLGFRVRVRVEVGGIGAQRHAPGNCVNNVQSLNLDLDVTYLSREADVL